MGTSLTGTKPKDTYDSLIKVGDNGPISGTAKYLSDGLGNDLPISVSTSYVGIGTNSPTRQLSISATNPQAVLKSTTTTGFSELYFGDSAADNGYIGYAHNGDYMYFGTNNAERVRILSGGGITFNGDATQANALDDYEEGTFTATITGGTFSSLNTGKYTKIGRMVYWYLNPTTTAITGALTIDGLPFTCADRSASIFANLAPSGVTYIPAFHNQSSASAQINVSGTYSGGSVSTYFAGVFSV